MYFTAGPSLRDHPAGGGRPGRARRRAARGQPAADPGRGGRDAHRDVRRPPGRRLRAPHPLAVRHGVRRRAAGRSAAGSRRWRCSACRTGCRSPATARAARTRRSPTSGRPCGPGVPAVLLANHGVLVFHRTPELAVLVGGVVEEAAQAGINAERIGGPVEIPEEMRAAALQRAMAFDERGHSARHRTGLAELHEHPRLRCLVLQPSARPHAVVSPGHRLATKLHDSAPKPCGFGPIGRGDGGFWLPGRRFPRLSGETGTPWPKFRPRSSGFGQEVRSVPPTASRCARATKARLEASSGPTRAPPTRSASTP